MVVYNDQDVIIYAPYKLQLKNTDGWWVDLECLQNGSGAGILQVDHSIKGLKDIAAYGGALMTASNPAMYNNTGGGCVQIGHGFERSETSNPPADPPRINLTDAGFNTLYITAGSSLPNGIDAVLANMKLDTINAKTLTTSNTNYLMTNVPRLSISTADSSWGMLQLGNTTSNSEVSIEFISGATGFGTSVSSQNGSDHFWCIGLGPWGIGGDTFGIGNGLNSCLLKISKWGDLTSRSINPWSDNAYGLGSGSNAWSGIVTYHLYHATGGGTYTQVFDSMDDLAAVKQYKIKNYENQNGKQWQEIDLDSLPFLKGESDNDHQLNNCWDMAKVQGFILGCLKASAIKHDSHDDGITNLLMRVEALEKQLNDQTAA